MKSCLFVLLFLFSLNANADGNSLLKNCKALIEVDQGNSIANPIGVGQCAGYLQGMSDLNALYLSYKQPTFFCMPSKVNNGQKAKVIVKYLNDHPEKLLEIDGGIVLMAFMDAFPCPK